MEIVDYIFVENYLLREFNLYSLAYQEGNSPIPQALGAKHRVPHQERFVASPQNRRACVARHKGS